MALTQVPKLLSVCVLIPLCNEEDSLPMLCARLHELKQSLEKRFQIHFVFVDDGSTDGTSRLLQSAIPEGTSYEMHVHPVNRGVGAAFRTGFSHAAADVVCTIDADCSYGPEHLLRMIEEVASDRTDVIVASPYHPQGGVEGVQRWRLLLSAQCSRLYRIVSPLKLHTYTSIFRAYRGSFVQKAQFRSDDFVSAVELLLSARYLGYRVSEMPLILHRRATGVSKMRIAGTIRSHLRLIIDCLLTRNGGHPSFCTNGDVMALPASAATQTESLSWATKLMNGLMRAGDHPSVAPDAEVGREQKGAFLR